MQSKNCVTMLTVANGSKRTLVLARPTRILEQNESVGTTRLRGSRTNFGKTIDAGDALRRL